MPTGHRLMMAWAAALMLALAACTSNPTASETGGDEGAPAIEATTPQETLAGEGSDGGIAEPPVAGEADQLARSVGADQTQIAQGLGRSIVFSADMTLAVPDVAVAGREVVGLMSRMGGILFGQDTVGLPEPRSVLVFRIVPDRFQDALDAVGELGEVRNQTVSAEDVTERVVDLESRITTAEASVVRLRGLIEQAADLETITDLETQLLERETLLETLRGQLRTVEDQVALATIAVSLTEAASRPAVNVIITAYPGEGDGGQSCPGDPELALTQGDPATLCVEVTNVGDTSLAAFEIRDPVLDLDTEDFVAVFGELDGTLEPGEFLIASTELQPERTIRTQTKVSATPLNTDGEPLPGRDTSAIGTALLEATTPEGLPGFGDGLATSWSAIQTLWGLIVLVAGLVLPFAWVPLLAWVALRWRRGRAVPPAVPGESGG